MNAIEKLFKKSNDKRNRIEDLILISYHCGHNACEDAATELAQLQDEHKFMSEQIDKLNTEMECGHLARYQVNEQDGTQYCSLCRSRSLEICDLEVRRQLNRMAVLYHQISFHLESFNMCEHPHCKQSRALAKGTTDEQ